MTTTTTVRDLYYATLTVRGDVERAARFFHALFGWQARPAHVEADDPWDATLDRVRATEVLCSLGDHHRLALTLRYVDGLPVPEVADLIGRTLHATEALLVRARTAFRTAYERGEPVDA